MMLSHLYNNDVITSTLLTIEILIKYLASN